MTRKRLLIAIAILTAVTIAFAQIVPPGDLDPGKPSTWFLTAAGWGFMVIFIVNFLKANLTNGLHGGATILVSLVLAVGGALIANTGLLSWLGINLEGTLGEVMTFGMTAFISSSGGWDTAKRIKAQPSLVVAADGATASALKAEVRKGEQ